MKGTFHEAKSKVKEMAGETADNPKLAAEGAGEKIAGKVQEMNRHDENVLGKQ